VKNSEKNYSLKSKETFGGKLQNNKQASSLAEIDGK
jgi:hypothetical protein